MRVLTWLARACAIPTGVLLTFITLLTWVSMVGCNTVGITLPGIPDALSKGTINGCVIPWEVVPSAKVHELTKFHAEFETAEGSPGKTTAPRKT